MSAGRAADARGFAARVIEWQRRCGRHDLPWQVTRDAYRIWVSEIMLQQTQVSTVIPYYRNFLQRFPDVHSLARARLDRVLGLWSGLGYYSRARNLHAAARRVLGEHQGVIPRSRDALAALPGIGRSTAAAIAVFSAGAREAILDGNVKRVLCRYFAVQGPPGAERERDLWLLAESLLPARAIEAYTQGLMDLGAGLCTRSKPRCSECPLRRGCRAKRLGKQEELPARMPRKVLPHRRTVMLLALCGTSVLLQRRGPGVWQGLWSLPEFDSRAEALRACRSRFGLPEGSKRVLPLFEHRFTHYRLSVTPLLYTASGGVPASGAPDLAWFRLERALRAALPAPVRSLLTASRGVAPGRVP